MVWNTVELVCNYCYILHSHSVLSVYVGLKAGIDIDAFAPRLSFFWGIGMNFYMVGLSNIILHILNVSLGNSQDESWASAMGSPDEREIWCQKSKVMATESTLPNLWMVTN